jgi:hypothetical protein
LKKLLRNLVGQHEHRKFGLRATSQTQVFLNGNSSGSHLTAIFLELKDV